MLKDKETTEVEAKIQTELPMMSLSKRRLVAEQVWDEVELMCKAENVEDVANGIRFLLAELSKLDKTDRPKSEANIFRYQ